MEKEKMDRLEKFMDNCGYVFCSWLNAFKLKSAISKYEVSLENAVKMHNASVRILWPALVNVGKNPNDLLI